MMQRRGFLAATLAAGMAPAIVRADSLMKVFVPSQRIFSHPGFVFPDKKALVMTLVDAKNNIWTTTYKHQHNLAWADYGAIVRIPFDGTSSFDNGNLALHWA